mmetsp:Transcript_84977/g.259489  ORF Transcript_84977/g.259489 Transcript_84977/m.259489 type:complete len:286 (-) Transcript_84977:367-1224(-)
MGDEPPIGPRGHGKPLPPAAVLAPPCGVLPGHLHHPDRRDGRAGFEHVGRHAGIPPGRGDADCRHDLAAGAELHCAADHVHGDGPGQAERAAVRRGRHGLPPESPRLASRAALGRRNAGLRDVALALLAGRERLGLARLDFVRGDRVRQGRGEGPHGRAGPHGAALGLLAQRIRRRVGRAGRAERRRGEERVARARRPVLGALLGRRPARQQVAAEHPHRAVRAQPPEQAADPGGDHVHVAHPVQGHGQTLYQQGPQAALPRRRSVPPQHLQRPRHAKPRRARLD